MCGNTHKRTYGCQVSFRLGRKVGSQIWLKTIVGSLTIKLFSPALLIVLLLHVTTSDLTAHRLLSDWLFDGTV